jgi:hypothetical protein
MISGVKRIIGVWDCRDNRLERKATRIIQTDLGRYSALVLLYGLSTLQAGHQVRSLLGVSADSNRNPSRTLFNIRHEIEKRNLDERARNGIYRPDLESYRLRLTS